jgi:NAD-specific glutamate dehydrogenase
MNGLGYIADSPPPEYGGFHPNAVRIAHNAAELVLGLERDLAARTQEVERLTARCTERREVAESLLKERDQLRASLDEAKRDEERLEWLEANHVQFLGYSPDPDMGGNQWKLRVSAEYRMPRFSHRTVRAAIDAAARNSQGEGR